MLMEKEEVIDEHQTALLTAQLRYRCKGFGMYQQLVQQWRRIH